MAINKYQVRFSNEDDKAMAFQQLENLIKYDGFPLPDRNLYEINEKHGLIRIWADSTTKVFTTPDDR